MNSLKPLIILLAVLAASGCKIEVTVPTGGYVTTHSNTYTCNENKRCAVEVTDTEFDETFIAVPFSGYQFDGWKKTHKGICGGKAEPCHVTTTGFSGNQPLVNIINSNDTFYLSPSFSKRPENGMPIAPESALYNARFWKRIDDEVDSGIYATRNFLYAYIPNLENCDPGVLTGAAKQRALDVLNEIRALHLLPDVEYDHTYDAEAQSTSLTQKCRESLTHYPDSSDRCYSSLAYQGASTSNLGLYSSHQDPAELIMGWVSDHSNVSEYARAGHRRWSLYPKLGYLTYGHVNGAASQKVMNFGRQPEQPPKVELDFVAFPYRTYPYTLVKKSEQPAPWSLSIIAPEISDYAHDFFSNSSVSVTQQNNSEALNVHSLYSDSDNYGTPNFLSWMVDDYDYDTTYIVTVKNIEYPDGQTDSIQYYVYLDHYGIFNTSEPLEPGDRREGRSLTGTFDGNTDKDSFVMNLSGRTQFTGKNSQYPNQAFFVLIYDKAKKLVASSDAEFSSNFSAGDYTVIVSLCDESGLCYQNVKDYKVTVH